MEVTPWNGKSKINGVIRQKDKCNENFPIAFVNVSLLPTYCFVQMPLNFMFTQRETLVWKSAVFIVLLFVVDSFLYPVRDTWVIQ